MWSRSRTSISSIRCFSVGGLFLAQWFIIITGFILFVGCHLAHFCSMSVEHTFVELRSRRRHRSFSVFRNNSLFHYEIPISIHFNWFYSKNKKLAIHIWSNCGRAHRNHIENSKIIYWHKYLSNNKHCNFKFNKFYSILITEWRFSIEEIPLNTESSVRTIPTWDTTPRRQFYIDVIPAEILFFFSICKCFLDPYFQSSTNNGTHKIWLHLPPIFGKSRLLSS